MRTNVRATSAEVPLTHEGARAVRITHEMELRRSVMACMLFEDEFYEDGVKIADRIADLVGKVDGITVAKIAREARSQGKLRHVPLWLARNLVKTGYSDAAGVLTDVIQRPDEITEFLALYWKDGRTPLAHSVKRGLAAAFEKFDEYGLAKYDRDEKIKLRDVLFMVHGKTKDIVLAERAATRATRNTSGEEADAHGDVIYADPVKKKGYKRGKVRRHGGSLAEKVVARTLEIPDTWEVRLSEAKTPQQKREVWMGLLGRKHLGALALLRNLRNMKEVAVPDELVREALSQMKVDRVLPFRFLTAARYAPALEPDLETAMFRCLSDQEKLSGETVVIVDVSGSMDSKVSGKSEIKRMDAACGVAILAREICEQVGIIAFSEQPKVIPARRGIALRDAIVNSMQHGNTNTQYALTLARQQFPNATRTIVITDEQSAQVIAAPPGLGYVMNVASAQHGIGYGSWLHVDGFSEAVIDFIRVSEQVK